MKKIKKRLETLTGYVLNGSSLSADTAARYACELELLQSLFKVWNNYNKAADSIGDKRLKERLDVLTRTITNLDKPECELSLSLKGELETITKLINTWSTVEGTEIVYDSKDPDEVRERKSKRVWDRKDVPNSLTTAIKLTKRQREALQILDDRIHDKVLLVGGSGSGKTFAAVYKVIRDALRHRAPCLVCRDKLVDLTQGVIEQTVPTILGMIAKVNDVDDWRTWTIDGLKFAKFTDKRTKLEFATGGYIRFGGLSVRDLSESGSDKILSPSWYHVEAEECSELDWDILEKLLTRLRHNIDEDVLSKMTTRDGGLNKLILTENPPSINHFSYKRFVEHRSEDGSPLSRDEIGQHSIIFMNPRDNSENLSQTYMRNLSQMGKAKRERFYEGKFQQAEEGEIFKRIEWTDNLPETGEWERICLYTDPTPLTTRQHSVYADFKASVLVGMFAGDVYLLDVRLVKGSTLDMLTNIKQLYDASPNQSMTEVLMENKQIPSDFEQVMQTFSVMTGWSVPIRKDKRDFGEKKQAIEFFLQPLFENGNIFFSTKFKGTERGRQTEFQVLKFSRKDNKFIHDDIPDALMKAVTYVRGNKGKKRRSTEGPIVTIVAPAYIQN